MMTQIEHKTKKLRAATKRFWVDHFGTPGMAINLWGVSPLYEFEGLKVGSIPTVTPIDKVLEEGNCGEVTNRGEEACECLVRKCHHTFSSKLRGYEQKRDTRPVWPGE